MKFVKEDKQVILREVPDEISLSINISNCPHRCPGCHAPYLQKNEGDELTIDVLKSLVNKNKGISCICFFGGDVDKENLCFLLKETRKEFPDIKLAVYSGDDRIDYKIAKLLDYYKVGPYVNELGPLDSKTTNQRMYFIEHSDPINFYDITYKFWNKEF